MTCIFCRIVARQEPAHRFWEDDEHIAILSIFPNTQGAAVVLPKTHQPSYAFALDDAVLCKLTLAAKKAALMLDRTFDDVGRTGMVMEGFGVDHVHAKLFPMHGTAHQERWAPIKSCVDRYFERYEGYISSHDHLRVDDDQLARLVLRIAERNRK